MRKTEFANDEYYHIYNRGVDKRDVFLDDHDYGRFLISLDLLNDKNDGLMNCWSDLKKCNLRAKLSEFRKIHVQNPIIEIIAYCLNPNHYHFILKQVKERGIEIFMHKLGTSYTHYFNKRNERSGSLFQGTFKSVHVDSNEYLLYLSAYINRNNFIHGYNKDANCIWKYSSLPEYLGNKNINLTNPKIIMGQFNGIKEYEKFSIENALYMKKNKELEKYLIES
jgi:putative transposase